MSRPLLFAHGWGYDGTVWDALVALLPQRRVFRVERGYLGAEPDWPVVPDGTVLVGHSAGLSTLLGHALPPGCAGLVSINGFTRFTATDGFPGVAGRVLERMRRGFDTAPGAVLCDFRARCGDQVPIADPADPSRLASGLDALREADNRAALNRLELPVLALAARDDPIVSPAHARCCFDEHELRWSAFGGHLLPLSRPDWCVAMIEAFPC